MNRCSKQAPDHPRGRYLRSYPVVHGCLRREGNAPMGILAPLVMLCCGRCGQYFSICRSCYRGHVYCGKECSETARLLSVKAAKRKRRQSEEGRLDHRDRERERRRRRREAEREARVGDHTSNGPAPTRTMLPFCTLAVHEAAEVNSEGTSVESNKINAEPQPAATHGPIPLPQKAKHRCAICGRRGYLVESFPKISSYQHSPRHNTGLQR